MINEQRQRIVALSLASRKASEEFGGAAHRYAMGSAILNLTLVREIKQEAEDAYAALLAAIYEATEDQQGNEWIEEPGK